MYKIKVKRDKILTKQDYYIDDNTVRKISSPQNTPSRQNVEEIWKQKVYRHTIKRNRQRAMAIEKKTKAYERDWFEWNQAESAGTGNETCGWKPDCILWNWA